ncbi:alpha/beta hydrolase family protein [Tahibacter soli]|uniref:S9 family peptidase n=1 Tax=Tahibacter soli TaxID=2983605 RepID=A0A9X4BLU8_9GAMM|nr:S9 family peptidase [Tahibacter soli]MDC8015732.1 S9 family peptidase [Tahibacter soli]
MLLRSNVLRPRFLVQSLMAVCGLAAVAQAQAAQPLPVADFAKHLQYRTVKISPDGNHIATDSMIDGKRHLTMIDLANSKGINIRPRGDDEVDDFWWVGPNRVVYTLSTLDGGLEQPLGTGELLAVDADGSANDILFGRRVDGQEAGSHIKKKKSELASATLIDTLRDDDEHVLISTIPFDSGYEGAMPEVFKLDVKDGSKSKLFSAPLRNARFLTDHKGVVRFAYAPGADNFMRVMYRDGDGKNWEEVYKAKDRTGAERPLAFDRTNEIVYWRCEKEGAVAAVCTWNVKERTFKPVWSSKDVDLTDLVTSLDEQDVVAITSMPGRAAVNPLDKNSDTIKTLIELMKQFPGEQVTITSCDKAGNRCIVKVASDINPAEFFLVDSKAKKMQPVLKSAPWIDPEKMASKEPFAIKSRDGLPLHGYLTKPLGKEAEKNLPLVVYVHGGPYGIRDLWEYDPDVQLMASRGYAVLQVNFRGSGGYGASFEAAGYREWGAKMQDDVTDATKWAIEQGAADPKRICIYGASYGGYAALNGAVREPDLYRCTIGYVGVYSLPLMFSRGDIQQSLYGENYLKTVLGEDQTVLAQRSPVNYVDRIKAKIMIVAAGMDKRVPPVHSQDLRIALEKKGIAHEWLYQRNEAHGYYDEKNREDMYTKLVAFLDANIGANAGAATAAPAAAKSE